MDSASDHASDEVYRRLPPRLRGAPDSAAEPGGPDQARPSYSSRLQQPQPKRGGKLKIVLAVVLAVVLLGVGGALVYANVIQGNLNKGIDDDLRDALVETDMTKEPFYVLLMGVDSSQDRNNSEYYGGVFRTDSIMLARIDPIDKKVTLISFDRDTLVDLGSYDTMVDENGQKYHRKLNEAYAFGGPALTVKLISNMTGVDISHYAEINFDGMVAVIDALGGIEVDVPVEINDPDAGGHVDAGLHTLSGQEALILCRSRNTYNDVSGMPDNMRAANQRLVLSATAKKMLDADIGTIARTITALSEYVRTDLSLSDIIGIAQTFQGIDPATDIYTAMQPTEAAYFDGGWYSFTVEDEWENMMRRMKRGLPPSEGNVVDEATGTVVATAGADASDASVRTASIAVMNGTERSGLAAEVCSVLEANGFKNAVAGDTNDNDYPHTEIVYRYDQQLHEAELIREILGQGRLVKDDPDVGEYNFDGSFLVIVGDDWNSSLMKQA
jgi:LCP family protein required for cell wall assembly